MEPFEDLKLSQFSPAIAWLLEKGISAERLGALFGTTAGNIRVLAWRARHTARATLPGPPFPELSGLPQSAVRRKLRIRPHPDAVILTRKEEARLDWLEHEIAIRFSDHAAHYRYRDGIESLRDLLPYVGYPAGARRLGLAARLHQKTAWLYFQSGFSHSALSEAERAMELSVIARRESGEGRGSEVYVRQFIDAAQVGSWALLIAREPERAWKMLERAHDACLGAGLPLPADQYRQRGVVLFQLGGRDDDARKLFRQSAELLAHQGEAPSKADVALWASRASLLDPADWDPAAERLAQIGQAFGAESVEYAGAVHWTAAAALLTDSPSAQLTAWRAPRGAAFTRRAFWAPGDDCQTPLDHARTGALLSPTRGLCAPGALRKRLPLSLVPVPLHKTQGVHLPGFAVPSDAGGRWTKGARTE